VANRYVLFLLPCLLLASCGQKSTVLNRRSITAVEHRDPGEKDAKQVQTQNATAVLEGEECDLSGFSDELTLKVLTSLDLSNTSLANWCQAFSMGDILLVQYVSDQSPATLTNIVNLQLTLQYSQYYARIKHIVASSLGDSDLSDIQSQMPAHIGSAVIYASSAAQEYGVSVLALAQQGKVAAKNDATTNLEFLKNLEALDPAMRADSEASPYLRTSKMPWSGANNSATAEFDVLGMR
jgi:hypothetical protein